MNSNKFHQEIYKAINKGIDAQQTSLISFIEKVQKKQDLTIEDSYMAMYILMSGKALHEEAVDLLKGLHIKGETVLEIASFAFTMRKFAPKVKLNITPVVDMCGTGGGTVHTFNISTTAMFIVAAAGIAVAKHGNRAITSNCGSADVLESLGVNINLNTEQVAKCIEKAGIGFMFAPVFHSATKNVQLARKSLPHRTIFNLLGPLTNPSRPQRQVLGVYDSALLQKMAEVLKILGSERVMVVNGMCDKENNLFLDEFTSIGENNIAELDEDGNIRTYTLSAKELGFKEQNIKELEGYTILDNIGMLRDVLSGKEKGPRRDVTVLNAAAGLVVADRAVDIQEGIDMAGYLIDSKAAYRKMEEFIKISNQM